MVTGNLAEAPILSRTINKIRMKLEEAIRRMKRNPILDANARTAVIEAAELLAWIYKRLEKDSPEEIARILKLAKEKEER